MENELRFRLPTLKVFSQSLRHVLFDCPLLVELHREYEFVSVEDAFSRDDIAKFLIEMERVLGIV